MHVCVCKLPLIQEETERLDSHMTECREKEETIRVRENRQARELVKTDHQDKG